MGMPLRITFNDRDYSFQVTTTQPITKDTIEIPIVVNGESLTLIKGVKGWSSKNVSEELDANLIQAIGRAIELRLRL